MVCVMVGKTKLFWIFVWKMSSFFEKNFGARYLIVEYPWLISFKLWNEGFLFIFMVHGNSMVRDFGQKLRIFFF